MNGRRNVTRAIKYARSAATATKRQPISWLPAESDVPLQSGRDRVQKPLGGSSFTPSPSSSRKPLLSRASSGTLPLRSAPPSTATSKWSRPSAEAGPSSESSTWRSAIHRDSPSPSARPALTLTRASSRSLGAVVAPETDTDVFKTHDHSDPIDTRRAKRRGKAAFKERGSLLSGGALIPDGSRSKTSDPQRHFFQKEAARDKKRALGMKSVGADLHIPATVTVGQLARLLNVRLHTLQRRMSEAGMQAEASYDHVLMSDYAALLAEEFGRNAILDDESVFDLYPPPTHPNPHLLPPRPPVVTIMGHVDHGKTTLLDTLRSSSVAAAEAGGMTQHIGAFSVPVKMGVISLNSTSTSEGGERLITFLDTPGHAAFSAMRARGTSITDLVVLVVAADDGVMPQTLEVINLVNQENERGKIGMVIAINKIDKSQADVEKTKHALLAAGVSLEEYGGDVPCVPVSGLTSQGLSDLVETLALMADVMDLRAERDIPVVGYVLESKVHKGLGAVATVLVSRGTLTTGTPLLAGTSICSTRCLLSSSQQPLESAGPGTPVLVTGWKSLPEAGDEVLAGSEAEIKEACANRVRKREMESMLEDVEAINASRRADKMKEDELVMKGTRSSEQADTEVGAASGKAEKKHLRVVIRGDVSGSVEALVGVLEGIGNHLAGVKVISTGVGDVCESDIMMAKATDAMIIAFCVTIPRSIEALASQNHVPTYSSNIIYRVMDDIRERVASLLPCTYETKVTGEATVLQLFDIHIKSKVTKRVAGCRVTNGIVERSDMARVVREGKIISQGPLETLRQLKKDVIEVKKGSECGINLKDFDDVREGDLIQMFKTIEVPGVF